MLIFFLFLHTRPVYFSLGLHETVLDLTSIQLDQTDICKRQISNQI